MARQLRKGTRVSYAQLNDEEVDDDLDSALQEADQESDASDRPKVSLLGSFMYRLS